MGQDGQGWTGSDVDSSPVPGSSWRGEGFAYAHAVRHGRERGRDAVGYVARGTVSNALSVPCTTLREERSGLSVFAYRWHQSWVPLARGAWASSRLSTRRPPQREHGVSLHLSSHRPPTTPHHRLSPPIRPIGPGQSGIDARRSCKPDRAALPCPPAVPLAAR